MSTLPRCRTLAVLGVTASLMVAGALWHEGEPADLQGFADRRAVEQIAKTAPGIFPPVSLGAFTVAWRPATGQLRIDHPSMGGLPVAQSLAHRPFVMAQEGSADWLVDGDAVGLQTDVEDILSRQTLDTWEDQNGLLTVRGHVASPTTGQRWPYTLVMRPHGHDELGLTVDLRPTCPTGRVRTVLTWERESGEVTFGLGVQPRLAHDGQLALTVARARAWGQGGGMAGTPTMASRAPAPYLATTGGRGLYLHNSEAAMFDLRRRGRARVTLLAPQLRGGLLAGGSLPAVVRTYTRHVTGRPDSLPAWTQHGAIVASRGGQQRAGALQRRLQNDGVPLAALWVTDFATTGSALYPHLRTLADEARRAGVRLLLPPPPRLTLRNDDAVTPVDLARWAGDLGAVGWLGMDGPPSPGGRQAAGAAAWHLHNRRVDRWAAVQNTAMAHLGPDAVFAASTGFVHSPRDMPLMWLDADAPDSVARLLSAGLAGYSRAVLGPGDSATRSDWMRHVALAAFMPVFVVGPANAASPVQLDHLARHARLFTALAPYRARLLDEAAATGAPLIRPMAFDPHVNAATSRIDTQFMLGPDIVVAPQQGSTPVVSVWLPAGPWRPLTAHGELGREVAGGGWIHVRGSGSIPTVYIRSGGTASLVERAYSILR